MAKMVFPYCTARTRRVLNDRPSRKRSTMYTMWSVVDPARRK